MSERLFTLLLAIFGGVYLWLGIKIEAPIAYDPLGPRIFPVVLGSFLVILCLSISIFYPMTQFQIGSRVKRLALTILFYLVTFKFLGFMLATTISVYMVARLVSSSWMEGLLTGLIVSIFFYGIFHFLLGVPLPLGTVFRIGG
ncbi:tripartite tricarboxylate transporter TctB family protein [Desulfopila aestuarii]|uniref:Putative tricarboxylic transport membrane protein n=1 Tax=Desulfopila aestuarii DSM 18488 TaxID=1121416 RepID=A0A1M7YF76_9BACT|nr:tripartite tricarboxylate transporter TctB family protein [Desulfopila aestuarii]SHO51231.1 putative tricarboxylic transport membrane protein [Desulfopila aestuarii DSM 18488]